MKATAETLLPHAIETVFACVADITRLPQWVSNFSEPRWIPRGDFSKLPTFMGKYLFNNRHYDVAIKVQTLHPPSRLVLHSDTVPFVFTSQIDLQADGGQTHIRYSLEAGSENAVVKLFILIFGKLAGRMLRKQLEADLVVLNELLSQEGQPTESSARSLLTEAQWLASVE
ncbi:MAG: hypothetical protein CSA54_02795 [Gammaproteobacteria bacterium]|nr:MAG: hypothetical protein CSA54_02795 [Gammaproteobacteria bacterium]